MAARLVPGLHAPVVALDHADKVQDLATSQRVRDDMAAHAEPVGPDQPALMRRQTLHRHQAAPGHDACEVG